MARVIIVELTNIGKRYLLEYRKRLSFKESFLNLFKRNSRQKEFWALKDINLIGIESPGLTSSLSSMPE